MVAAITMIVTTTVMPRHGSRRNRPLEFQRRAAVNLFFARRFAEKHPRQTESLL